MHANGHFISRSRTAKRYFQIMWRGNMRNRSRKHMGDGGRRRQRKGLWLKWQCISRKRQLLSTLWIIRRQPKWRLWSSEWGLIRNSHSYFKNQLRIQPQPLSLLQKRLILNFQRTSWQDCEPFLSTKLRQMLMKQCFQLDNQVMRDWKWSS